MTKKLLYKVLLVLFILILTLPPMTQALASPSFLVNSKVLTLNRAIASWPSGIPLNEKRPVLVFLPGWSGSGAVNAVVSAQNTNLVNEGYVTLAIGFDSTSTWNSDIDLKTRQGLDKLCIDGSIPANCNAIVLVGSSYGAAQNYWVMEHLRSNGYGGGNGSTGKVLGFLSQDGGYGAPGTLTNSSTGAYTRTGLANTLSYSVAMIENLGDTTFPVDECTWGNCGARVLSNAHLARGDNNVFSICPAGGEHGTRGFANWNAWVISALKTMIHITSGIPTFTGYTAPTLTVGNTCVNTVALPGLSVSGINIVANGQPIRLRGVNMGDPFWARNPDWYPNYSIADYATLSQDWHANVVRISIFPTQWKHMDHAVLLAGLAQEVNAALNNGLYVIISYHVIGWPNGFYQSACCGNAADTYDSSMTVATSFWTQMAQTYGADTRIIFDLWNEPVHDSSDWVGVTPNPYWSELKLAYESLIQTVRTNGAQNIVLATGNRWASWLVGIKDNPLADSKVVYAYHKYSVEGLNTPAEWNKDTGGLIGVKPVLVSEWGYEDADVVNPTWPGSQASYGVPFTQWMDENNLGNLAWMYHHDWTPGLLKLDGSTTNYGTFVKQYISTLSSDQAQDNAITFAAFGDFGANTAGELAVANLVDGWNPDFIVAVGDNSYGSAAPVPPAVSTIDQNIGKYYHDYIGDYVGGFPPGSTPNRFFPAIGNHEYTDGGGNAAYFNYFTLPGNERYYDFIQGTVHFFVLDSNPPGTGSAPADGRSENSVQGTWLQTQLAASTSQWNIVYFHHPPFSSSSVHGSDSAMQWPFEAWGATAVLNGHDHDYERVMRDDDGDGVNMPYFVTGLGGNTPYGFATPIQGSTVRYYADYGSMRVQASSSAITFEFWSVAGGGSGTLIDSYTINAVPEIRVNGTLNPFSSQPPAASAEQSYSVSGINLTDNIVINAPSGFEISTASGAGFGASVTLTQSSGTVAPTPIYVRFNPAGESTTSGNITHTSTGAITQTLEVSGTTNNTYTLTFQNGLNGYSGTVDTFLRGTIAGGTNFNTDPGLEWDDNVDATTDESALIRFTNLFTSEGGSIPNGVSITSASLNYMTTDLNLGSTAYGNPANVYESIVNWDGSTVTYNNFGGEPNIQADEYNPTLIATAIATAISSQYTIDVTASLQHWSDGTANYGWIFLPTGNDGVTIYSSDYATVANHPLLAVTFTTTSPAVTSITRASANPTSATTVDFTVTFSENVTDVDANDFSLVTSGVTGTSITGISGSDATRTVTVNTGSGYGTIRLDVPGTATITDMASNPLILLPFTAGQTYDKAIQIFLPMIMR